MNLSNRFRIRYSGRQTFERQASVVARTTSPLLCEWLESRRLLTTYPWTITYSGPTPTSASLEPGQLRGQVNVWLNTNDRTRGPDHTFTNTTGMDVIDAGNLTNFTFIDRVHAVDKPRSDGHDGTKVQGGSGNTLRIEAGDNDTWIRVIESNSTNTVVEVIDHLTTPSVPFAHSRTGSGISNLVIRTNDVPVTHFRGDTIAGSEGTDVDVPNLYSAVDLVVDTGDGTYDRVQIGDGYSISQQVTVKTGAGNDEVTLQVPGDDGADVLIDFGDGDNGELGLHNRLIVNSVGAATLGPVGSPHTVVVDEIDVTSGGNLVLDQQALIGDLHIAGGSATLAADGTRIEQFTVDNSGTASVEAQTIIGRFDLDASADFSGTSDGSTVEGILELNGTLNMLAGSDFAVETLLSGGTTGTVNAADTAVLNVDTGDIDGRITFNLTSTADVTVGTFDAGNGDVYVNNGGL
jgi:hypothetical protein